PLDFDFIIALPANGLNLRYDGSLQRLKSVECYDPSKVKLVYQSSDVSSSRTIPTFLLIYKSFGPTYPGEFDSNQSIYTLKYPGLAFTFPIPVKHQNLYKSSTDLPLEFPDGTTPIASKVILYSNSNTWQQATVPPLAKFIAESNASNSAKYGKLAQDILADLGKPSRTFYKEEDKMKIHSVTDTTPTDYFFNYFHLGIDILIDGGLHVCKKIVLHGNVPGHYDFQRYKMTRMDYIIAMTQIYLDTSGRIPWETSNAIKDNTPQQKPVILTRGSSEQNPFGSTYLTGYDEGVVMEVMKNGYVPTIVLF
ncbi:hypothetical protein MUCCIDRAFT_134472, partial [Mucor lusitanicus CBS 277.49]